MNERRTDERRLSPAVGEYAIQECARLREQVKELREALQAAYDHMACGMGIDDFHDSVCIKARSALAKANQCAST